MMSQELERETGCLIPMSATIVAILSGLTTIMAIAWLMPSTMDEYGIRIIGIMTAQMIVIQTASAYAMRHVLAVVTVFAVREVKREIDLTARGHKSKLRWHK